MDAIYTRHVPNETWIGLRVDGELSHVTKRKASVGAESRVRTRNTFPARRRKALHHEHHLGVEWLHLGHDVGVITAMMHSAMMESHGFADTVCSELTQNARPRSAVDVLNAIDVELWLAERVTQCALKELGVEIRVGEGAHGPVAPEAFVGERE